MTSRRLATVIAAAALAVPATAHADAYLPPAGHVFAGVTGGSGVSGFAHEVGKHPAVFQFFSSWNAPTQWMFNAAKSTRTRLMIHISTAIGSHQEITPRGIASGRGDAYLLRLGQRIADSGNVVYIRLMAEMDGNWNAYCAYNANGSSRGREYSTLMFRRAWQRTVLILRGGPLATIDARLHALGLPPVTSNSALLAAGKVAFLWVPQVAGNPDTAANSPRAYWPGAQYVDWVGTDFYSMYPNWSGLQRFYDEFRGKPFVFAEWALWGGDDAGFVHRLFGFLHSHRSVRMIMYNQGNRANGPFSLKQYPRGTQALRQALRSPVFAPFAPGL